MVEELVSNERENDDNDVGTTDPNFADEEENPQNSNPKLTNSIVLSFANFIMLSRLRMLEPILFELV